MIFFWTVFAVELVVIGFLADEQPWLWMLLLSMPLLGAYLEEERRNVQRLIVAFLDEIARQRDLQKVRFDREAQKFVPVGGMTPVAESDQPAVVPP
jgi:hypothetical protein